MTLTRKIYKLGGANTKSETNPPEPEPLILDPKIKVILNDLNTTLGTLSKTGNPNGVDMSLFINQVKQIGSYALLKNKK